MKSADNIGIGIDRIIEVLRWLDTCQVIVIVESDPNIIWRKIHQFLSNPPGPKRKTRSNPTEEVDPDETVNANRCVKDVKELIATATASPGENNDNDESNLSNSADNRNRTLNKTSDSVKVPVVVLHRLEDITWRLTEGGKLIGDEMLMNSTTGIIRKPICMSVESTSSLTINICGEPVQVKTDEDIELEFDNPMDNFEPIPVNEHEDVHVEIKDEMGFVIMSPPTVSEPTSVEDYDGDPDPELEPDDHPNIDIDANNLPNTTGMGEVITSHVDKDERSRENIFKANSTIHPNTSTQNENQDLQPDNPEDVQCPPKIVRKTIGVGDMMINRVYEVDEVVLQLQNQDNSDKPGDENISNGETDALISSIDDDGSAEVIQLFDPIQAPDIPASTSVTLCTPNQNQTQKKIKKSFTCAECGKIFESKQTWRNHMRRHENLKNFACQFCPKAFNFKNQLTVHELIHTGKPYLCEQCPKTYVTPGLLKNHIKFVHCGVKPFACSDCDKRFSIRALLRAHSVCHSDERPLKCKLCPMAYKRSLALINHHRRTHTGEKPYKCNMCERAFVTGGELILHKKRNHK